MKITKTLLKSKKACKEHLSLFVETFPDGAEVNVKSLKKALDVGLDVKWLARNLLNDIDAYYVAISSYVYPYSLVIQPHWDAYKLNLGKIFIKQYLKENKK